MNLVFVVSFFTMLGSVSSAIGAIIASFIKNKSNVLIASLYELTSGIMFGIICFDMIPESFIIAPKIYTILGIIIGISFIYFIDYLVISSKNKRKKLENKFNFKIKENIHISNTSLIVIIAMSLHNAIEGLAIGSGFSYSYSLGLSILISMFLHDIPEGIVVGVINIKDKKSNKKTIFNSALVGSSVGIGCGLGLLLGNISDTCIAFCLALAAGAMLYIIVFDLQIEAKKITNRKITAIMYIIGVLIVAIIN